MAPTDKHPAPEKMTELDAPIYVVMRETAAAYDDIRQEAVAYSEDEEIANRFAAAENERAELELGDSCKFSFYVANDPIGRIDAARKD